MAAERSPGGLTSIGEPSAVDGNRAPDAGAPTAPARDERMADEGVTEFTRKSVRPMIGAVRIYQRAAAGRPSPCRHVPSCSTYAIEALERHGAARGTWLAARRLLRCHPWGTQGYDPVPERKRR
jgi:putative membrane protein insertion efficiency factor